MAKHGKKYQEVVKLVDPTKAYSLQEAVELAKKTTYVKFDETVELHLRMNLDQRSADQQIRGIALLPHGLGKKLRILVFAQGEAVKIAEEAGADYVGSEDLIKKIEGGWLDFDVTVATPDVMSKIGKLGKTLGRKGLMPNPKLGTVVAASDLPRVIRDASKGRAEFRLDRTGNIHLPIGKMSFETTKLVENLSAAIEAIVKAKPSGAKGQYIKSATISTSMGPGITLDLRSAVTAL
ncbi:MAG: 50S ribosomal protein L1 [Chloroflexi bacterium RBG_13_53_26]|nr:MAG: 50S ribosomal protein L1 [Chloroflexi bacterium RBG_13_53_26]